MTVYKYCHPTWGLEILKALEVKLTSPNRCNDPFEFQPRIICTNELDWIKTIPDTQLSTFHRKSHPKWSFDEFKNEATRPGSEVYNCLVKVHKEANPRTQRAIQDEISKECAILCLSKKHDSIPMWGYYCDGHRGLVIGFDESHILFQPSMGDRLTTVDYVRSHERVAYDLAWNRNSLEEKIFNQRIIYWKSEDWIHEAELRQIFRVTSLKPKELVDGSQGYFLKIPAEAIVSVLFGIKCSDCFQDAVRSALRQAQFSHVRLYKGSLDESKFEMMFRPVEH